MPELHRLLHPLEPDVRCPYCDASFTFAWVMGSADLYHCTSGGPCKCQLLHYRNEETQTCGYAFIYDYGPPGEWTACGMPAAKGE